MSPAEKRTPRGGQVDAENNDNDNPSIGPTACLDKSDDDGCARAAVERQDKAITTLKARAALAGYGFHIVDAGGGKAAYLLARWNRSIELTTLQAVEDFLARVGAK